MVPGGIFVEGVMFPGDVVMASVDSVLFAILLSRGVVLDSFADVSAIYENLTVIEMKFQLQHSVQHYALSYIFH